MQKCAHCGSAVGLAETSQTVCPGCLLRTAVEGESEDAPDDSFGSYEIICEIGQGGMGIVYLAEQSEPVRREVAIKVLKPGLDTRAILRRFETERQALAIMEHPNIASFYDAGASSRGRPFFVMEFVEGEPITAAADRRCCSISERLTLFADVCRAVEHAHRKGVIHRDLKPSNVLIAEREGRLIPKVIDFGIARAASGHLTGQTIATVSGEFLGTPEYASPEQAGLLDGHVGPAADIYSLGILLYELVAGVLPFDPDRLRESGIATATRIIREEEAPAPAKRLLQTGLTDTVAKRRKTRPETLRRVLSQDVAKVLRVCLEKDPSCRYASAGALADDIDRYLRGEPVLADGPTPAYRVRRLFRQHRYALSGTVGAVITASLALALLPKLPRTSPSVVVRPLTASRGTEIHPSFSPDGARFAFVSDGGIGNFDIYVQSVEGGAAPIRVTNDVNLDLFPAWSPDGRDLAFIRLSQTEQTLMIVPAAGGEARAIAPLRNRDLIWVQNPASLTRKPGPVWAPDSRSVVVATAPQMNLPAALYRFQVHGGGSENVTAPEADTNGDFSPAFSPDGRSLAFVRRRSMRGNESIFVAPVNSGQPKELLAEAKGVPDLAWLSNSEILFSSNRSGPHMLWHVSLRGGAPEPVSGAGRGISFFSYSRARDSVLITEEIFNKNIWRVELRHGKPLHAPEQLLFSSRRTDSAEISPDGESIVFVSDRLGTRQIWVSKADGSNSVQISSVAQGVPIGTPRWSPDSRHIVYDTMHKGHSAIAVMRRDGRDSRILASDSWDNMMPSWSRDGQWIYFACRISGDVQVCRKSVSGSATIPMTTHGGGEPRPSPDGRFVFYAKARGIWRVPRDGGAETALAGLENVETGRYWTIAKDALYLLASTQQPWAIQRYDLASGKLSTVTTMPKPPDFGSPGLTIFPDLRWLLFCQIDERGSDVVMAEHIAPR